MFSALNVKVIIGAATGAALMATGAYWYGYLSGHDACAAAQQKRLLESIREGERLEEARREIAQERDDLARELEVAANADPVVISQCLGPSRVQRLNSLR